MTTLLLIPTALGKALLDAGVCGSRPPIAHLDHVAGKPPKPCPVCGSALRWFRPPTDQMDPQYICTADAMHRFRQADILIPEWQVGPGYDGEPRALCLVLNGGVIPEACDRAARVLAPVLFLDPTGGVLVVPTLYRSGREIGWHMEDWNSATAELRPVVKLKRKLTGPELSRMRADVIATALASRGLATLVTLGETT